MNQYLQSIPFVHPDSTRRMLADGIIWADQSCRISGTLSLAIRNASNEQIDAILDQMLADGCTTMGDAPRWLNANYLRLARFRFTRDLQGVGFMRAGARAHMR